MSEPRFSTDKATRPCNCRSVGECQCNTFAEHEALASLVDAFAAEMKRKLEIGIRSGRAGWDDPEWAPQQIAHGLLAHVAKGDPVDVANFCAFLWNRGRTDVLARAASELLAERDRLRAEVAALKAGKWAGAWSAYSVSEWVRYSPDHTTILTVFEDDDYKPECRWRWRTPNSSIRGTAPTANEAMAAADAALLAAGWYLEPIEGGD